MLKNETGTFEGDYFYLGKSLVFNGEAEDVTFLGEELDFKGNARLKLTALGKNMKISGSAHNGLTVGGVNITLKDISYIAAKELTITKNARIEGDLFTGI